MSFQDRVGRILNHVTGSAWSKRRLLLLDDRTGPVGGCVQKLIGSGPVRYLLVQTRSRWHLAGGNNIRSVATTATTRLMTAARWRRIAV